MTADVVLPLRGAGTMAAGRPMVRRLAAVAFLDVVDYSRLMGADDEATLRAWSALQRAVIEPLARTWRGRIAGRAGDGLLLEFRSALDVFRWAVAVQEGIAAGVGGGLRVRIALHLGDVIDDTDGQVMGDGVNTAARLQGYAEPGGIVVSQALASEVMGRTAHGFQDLGAIALKNIERPVRAYRVVAGGAAARPRRLARLAVGAAAACVAGVLAAPAAWRPHRDGAVAATRPTGAEARALAVRLTEQARAVPCEEHPCFRAWLAQRALYEQAISADSDYGPPYAYAALTYANFVSNDLSLNEATDLREAERLATQAALLAPNDAISFRARGNILMMQPDRLNDALSAFQRALALDPGQVSARANSGWVLILLGRPADAEPYLRQAVLEAPDGNPVAMWLTFLGLAELFQGKPGHGADYFRDAIARQSKSDASTDFGVQREMDLAAALALNGSIREAGEIRDAMMRQNPTLSTRAVWNCDCSAEPGYKAGMKTLLDGVKLAGFPEK